MANLAGLMYGFDPSPKLRRRLRLLSCLLATLIIAACGAPAALTEAELEDEASRYFEHRNYVQAISNYEELLEQFPFSEHAESASLKIAQAYYLTEQYEKAIAAFNDFERLYPVSPMLPLVEYSVGMCHLDRALDGDRDTGASADAKRQFERLLQRYPDSVYSRLAEFRLRQSIENLARHELYVGDYYRARGHDEAAAARYRYLLEKYPESESAAEAGKSLGELAGKSATPTDAASGGGA